VYEIVRSFGGKERWIGRGRFNCWALNFVAATAPVATASMSADLIVRGKERFFIFLQSRW